jgi:ribosome-binding protein aMBF1 (putative translation factor)
MSEQVVTQNGKRFVMVEEREWQRVRQLAAMAEAADNATLPEYPPADEAGNRPAVAFARVSIARKIIEARRAAGLSQEELARQAGVRQETISRIESGKHSPTIRTVEKIERALNRAAQKAARNSKKRS